MSFLKVCLRAVGMLFVVFTFVFFADQSALAQDTAAGETAEHSDIGLGIIVSGETGINAKFFLTRNLAIDATFGGLIWGFRGRGLARGLHIDTDFQYHLTELVDVAKGELDFYIGAGIGFNRWKRTFGFGAFGAASNTVRIGELRFPVGTEYYYVFEPFPMSFFAEVVPKMYFGSGAAGDGTFNLGARIHF